MATLQGKAIKDTFKDLLQVSNGNNGVDGTLRNVEDGEGTASALQLSSGVVKVNGDLNVTGNVEGVPHVDYKGAYASGTSYIKDDVVTYNGSSYINTNPSTGVAPTNTGSWGLLAQKGTDGSSGTNGSNGSTGPAGPAGADGNDGQDFSGYSYLTPKSLALLNTGSTGNAAIEVGSPNAAYIDLKQPSSDDYDLRIIHQGTGAIESVHTSRTRLESSDSLGLCVGAETASSTPAQEVLTLTKKITAASAANYNAKLEGSITMTPQDTDDQIENNLSVDGDSVLYNDFGSNLNFRTKHVGSGGAQRIYSRAIADTETDVPNNVSLHLASDKHDTPTGTIGYRNTGRSTNYTGTSDPNIELVGSNIKQYQTAVQTQKSTLRTSITLQYEPEDVTQSDWNGGVETGISGGAGSGEFAGVYLTATSTSLSQQRSLRPSAFFDGAMNLGDASTRWSTVYATGGSINTSDRNVKQDIEDLSDAEKSVAIALKGLIKKYRFKDAVAAKGDDARIHVGVIAQDVEQAFIDAGLDGFRYGILCKDTVYKVMVNGSVIATQTHNNFVEEGADGEPIEGATLEAEDRYAVRYEELLAFVVSSL